MDIPDYIKSYIRASKNHHLKDYNLYVDNHNVVYIKPQELPFKIEFVKINDDYFANLTIQEYENKHQLDFSFFKGGNTQKFLNYCLGVLTTDAFQFFQTSKGIILKDYRVFLLEINNLEIRNCIIDKKMIEIIKKYFKNLEALSLSNCTILKECNLSELNCRLILISCTCEDIRSLNACNKEICLNNVIFNKIDRTVIYSKKMEMDLYDNVLRDIFFKVSFPNLEEINITEMDRTLNECLLFLPSSMPNLRNIYIEGSVYSFDFLYHITNLNICEIESKDNSIGPFPIFTPYILNDKEREDIIDASGESANSDLDVGIILQKKLNSIVNAMKKIRYSRVEVDRLISDRSGILHNSLKHIRDGVVDREYIYDSNNDKLYLDLNLETEFEKAIFKSFLYSYRKSNYISQYMSFKDPILKGISFMYHSSGLPIEFKKEINYDEHVKYARDSAWNDYDETINEEYYECDNYDTDDGNLKGNKDKEIEELIASMNEDEQLYYLYFFDANGECISEISSDNLDNISEHDLEEILLKSNYFRVDHWKKFYGNQELFGVYIDSFVTEINEDFIRVNSTDEVLYGSHLITKSQSEFMSKIKMLIESMNNYLQEKEVNFAELNQKILTKIILKSSNR